MFGVEFTVEGESSVETPAPLARVMEDTEVIDDSDGEDSNAVAAYYTDHTNDSKESKFDNIQFDSRLGLAIESLQEGVTLEQLWKVI